MSDETKKAVEEFVQKMLAGAEHAGQFTAEQMPLLVQEWLRWELVSYSLLLLVFTVIAIGCFWLLRFCTRQDEKHPDEEWGFPAVIVALGCIISLVFWLFTLASLLKILIAPRVVILEKFMELIK